MKQYLQLFLLFSILFYGIGAYAFPFQIRNTYPGKLICTEENKPHAIYTIPANKKNDFSNVPTVDVKAEGKYICKTDDKMYQSVCSVSELQPKATFDTDEGAISCSIPVKLQ